jgi:hypothetical protein
MNCKEARKWLSPYLDSELGSTKTFEVSEHLRHCPECTTRFNAERRADDMFQTSLRPPAMPAELWSTVSRDVATRFWFRTFPLRFGAAGLALAACLAIVYVGTAVLQPQKQPETRPWLVSRLLDETAGKPGLSGDRQTPEGPSVDSDRAAGLLRTQYQLELVTTAAERHDLRLISATQRADEAGREFIEVRLKCCGRSVLLALARSTDGEFPSVFSDLPPTPAQGKHQTLGGVHIASRDIGDLRAVVASRHVVGHIVENLRLLET